MEWWGELHDRSMDIHLWNGIGDEIAYVERDYVEANEKLLTNEPEQDMRFITAPKLESQVILKKGYFVVFFPGELHRMRIKNPEDAKKNFVKLLLKIYF